MKDVTLVAILFFFLLISLIGNSLQYLMIESAENEVEAKRIKIVILIDEIDGYKKVLADKAPLGSPIRGVVFKNKRQKR